VIIDILGGFIKVIGQLGTGARLVQPPQDLDPGRLEQGIGLVNIFDVKYVSHDVIDSCSFLRYGAVLPSLLVIGYFRS
jgi:hypothetical protein